MFTKSAVFYDALYQFKDYREAVELMHKLIQRERPGSASVLDVACGTGKHIEFLKDHYEAEGLDLNSDLLEIARERCPDTLFHEADMTSFELGKKYDVVACLFSSIGYVQSKERLNAAVSAMAAHLVPGGLLIVEPWIWPGKYWKGKLVSNVTDQEKLKISWMYIQEQVNMTSVFNIHYLVGTEEEVSYFSEHHVMGLWTDEEYRDAFAKAGLTVTYEEKGFFGRGVYYGALI
jgi:ubiquinone/menaquinone biosynthesis C-methylase UbiE